MSVAKLIRREPRLVIDDAPEGTYVLYESHLASVAHLEKALRLISECTPIPGPGLSLVMSIVSVAKNALAGSSTFECPTCGDWDYKHGCPTCSPAQRS